MLLQREERMARPVIAVVEDDPALAMFIVDLLLDEGYDPRVWPHHQEAWHFICTQQPQLVIVDIWLHGYNDGVELLQRLGQHASLQTVPVIVCSGDVRALTDQAARLDPQRHAMLAKPFDLDDLLATMQRLLALAPAMLQQTAPHSRS
jgi:DNA-binding response OmpR family regulator